LNLERTFDCPIYGSSQIIHVDKTDVFFLCWFACTAMAQKFSVPKPASGSIVGTVTDVQDEVVPGASVVLDCGGASGQQKATTNQSGFFSFSAVQRFTGMGRPAAWIAADVVRFEDGLLAEHWDVLQDEATRKESVSGLPMFGDTFPS
jgi:hypothetical protein